MANGNGGLLVKTAQNGATVTRGGEAMQQSPATFTVVQIGTYPLRVSVERYQPVSREVEIKENDLTDLGGLSRLQPRQTSALLHQDGPVTQLLEAREERTVQRFQKQLDRQGFILLDEPGYVAFSKARAELLFDVVSRAYERNSLIVTTNLPFEQWTEVLGSG